MLICSRIPLMLHSEANAETDSMPIFVDTAAWKQPGVDVQLDRHGALDHPVRRRLAGAFVGRRTARAPAKRVTAP